MPIVIGGVTMTKVIVNGTEMDKVIANGQTVFEKVHVHTDACYEKVICYGTYFLNADWKPQCGSCGSVITDWDTTGHTLPEYPCGNVIERKLICGY